MKQFCSLILAAGLTLTLPACAVLEMQRAQSELSFVQDVEYAAGGNVRHRLDIVMPRDARNVPVVFFVHGGYWNSQDKAYFRDFTGLYANVGIALARRGIGAVIVDYRIYPETAIDGELEDLIRALRWTQQHIWRYGGDPRRLVLAGHSAGGHMISLLGLDARRLKNGMVETDWIRGLAPMSPILDLAHMAKSQNAEFNRTTTYPVFGTDQAKWSQYAPVSFFGPDLPPMLISYGEKDSAYLLDQQRNARAQLAKLGAPAEHLLVPGYSHEDMVLKFGNSADPLLPALVDFVRRVAP